MARTWVKTLSAVTDFLQLSPRIEPSHDIGRTDSIMKTSASSAKNEHRPVFLNRVTKPHVFSKMIEQHGAALKQENHLSVVPHQILNPDYNPQKPKLKVEYPTSSGSQGSVVSFSPSQSSDMSSSFSPRAPKTRTFLSANQQRAREAGASNNSAASDSSAMSEVDLYDPSHRYTIMELEAILIREKTKMKKLQLELDAVSSFCFIQIVLYLQMPRNS